ncbi:Chromosome partition protein Smc [Posidoniimonas polymericola]|uniref:Chromosome partition protein Smc n=1 Tax=Posidoniimonas polymericola TaxID=2528002 RepID=A0A5C5YKV6_9BACT|nr:hypothetical protein [Posidoniimonas polymericola]TWT75506.1 Chromosome partition protein Smc [Posidoniimonas polymericola]
MSVTQVAVEQARAIMQSGDLNEQQLEQIMQLGGLIGEKPTPSGYRAGEPFWTVRAVQDWATTAKRCRADASAIEARSAVLDGGRAIMATLTGRQHQRDLATIETLDEIALEVASGKAEAEDVEARLEAIGSTVADLGKLLLQIESRGAIIRRQADAAAAQVEVDELGKQITEQQAKLQKAAQPIREKISELSIKQQDAQRRSQGEIQAWLKLRNSSPDWLRQAYDDNQQAIRLAGETAERLSRELSGVERRIEELSKSRAGVVQRLQLLAGAVAGDYEAKKSRERFIEEQQTIESQLGDARARKARCQIDRAAATKDLAALREHGKAIESVMATAAWPLPSDLAE